MSGGESALSGLPLPPGGRLAKPGGAAADLKVLDWAGFKGAVSYTFDDSNQTQIASYAELAALGVRMTFYLQTGKPESASDTWRQALEAGHELGNHTKSHDSNGPESDIDEATAFLENTFGAKVWTMAAPNGSSLYTSLAKTRFMINRGVSNKLILPRDATDEFTLPCFIPAEASLAARFDEQIDSARAGGGWRVVLVHGFSGGTDRAYQPVALEEFVKSVNHAKDFGDLWIDSVVNVGAYWLGQRAFSAAPPAVSDEETSWTWTLPARFPPNKYLRVTVSGGRLIQNGEELPWNDRGFYEVSLDAKNLTLSP